MGHCLSAVRHAGLAIAASCLVAGAPVAAAPRCHQGFQDVGGSSIATPYCQDQYIAEVARGYGMRVSAAEIRNNPNAKRDVCRFVGRDARISHYCPPGSGRGGRF